MNRYHICLSGSGGQGLILAGVLLADAAVKDGKNVALTSSYGPEARGGASRSNLVISDEPIDYPMPDKMDLILSLNQESCSRFAPELKDNGILVIDSNLVTHHPPIRHYSVPFTEMAQKAGAVVTANVAALGAITALTGIVKRSSLENILQKRIRKNLWPINGNALKLGLNSGRKLKKNRDEYFTY
jgi:2-oxoglutarate ferredoxin oxidoreductase subunit gamma